MRKPPIVLMICVAMASAGASKAAPAEEIPAGEPGMVREIFVPFEDLNVLLEDQPRRVLLSRQEFEELAARAKKVDEARPPRAASMISADYQAVLENERATITGAWSVDVFQEGLHMVGLDLAGVGLRRAVLDGKSAPIGRADDGRVVLFVEGKGRHTLTLEMVTPLETTAAQQVLNFMVPTPAATRFRLTVPGDVEVKSGCETISRVMDEAAGVTRFELLPKRDKVSLVMTLNSRLLRKERVVVARSVIVDELTQAYERLHATFSMAVLHKAVNSFRFALPEGFEVTDVQSPLLARWGIAVEGESRILDIRLREQATDTVVLSLSAVRTAGRPESWALPTLEPLDVQGRVSVVGLLIEDGLRAESIESEGLIRIDTATLAQALPASVFQAEPGAPRIRPIVSYYAPQSRFRLSAKFRSPEPRLTVTTNLLLTLSEKGQEVRGGFALLPDVEKLFAFDFTVPVYWHVTSVTAADNSVLPFERFGGTKASARIRVLLSAGVAPGQEYHVYFQAERVPAGWLDDWASKSAAFPVFAVASATREAGAIAVAARDDLRVRSEALEQLTPLDENEKAKYGLAGVPTNLAYRFESQPYSAKLTVERVLPRLTARTYSFLVVRPDSLLTHYEICFDVQEARTRRLALSLPESTPVSLSIRGLDGVGLKEYGSETADGVRRWSVILGESRRGVIRLAVDFQQPLTAQEPKDLVLPVVRAEDVAYQSGIVVVEGDAELDVAISSALRKVDVGELAEAEHQPGKRLLGAYRFVGDSPAVSISVSRPPGYGLPLVLVQRAELATLLSAGGLSQTAARFHLRTKAQFLQVQLPAGSTLWSAELDGKPAKPQREGQRLLLSLPAGAEAALRDLRIVYETPVDSVRFLADLEVLAPALLLGTGADAPGRLIPVADLVWHLHLPTGYRVIRAGGTVVTDEIAPPELAVFSAARFLYTIGGGVHPFYDGYGLARGRELARRVQFTPYDELGAVSEELHDREYAGVKVKDRPESAPPPQSRSGGIPATKQAAAATPSPPKKAKGKYVWALEGVRSLKIDLEQTGEQISFRSLGLDPTIAVTLTHTGRLDALAWGLACAVGLIGLAWMNRPVRSKVSYIVVIALVTTLAPLVAGSPGLTCTLNPSFYAAMLLVPAYLAIGLAKRFTRRWRPALPVAVATATIVLALTHVPGAQAAPAKPATPVVVKVCEPPKPVAVPADAIILPYDPESDMGIKEVDQLLVPYDKFVELWNRAYPDKSITTAMPPASYALAGASYTTTLEGDEYLLIEGKIDFDVYADGFVTIPLPLAGGVLTRTDLDGQPARLSVTQAKPPATDKEAAARQAAEASNKKPVKPGGSIVSMYASGKGRHRLNLAVRMRLGRRGGWRAASGRLPGAAASALAIRVPKTQTEIRLSGVSDRQNYVTTQASDLIETTLGEGGAINIRWRPKVSEGQVDQSLTAESGAVLDVQEDGLRLVWRLKLAFRRSERDAVRVQVPREYLVVKVEGGNVRGWETRPAGDRQELDVTLLKPAKDREGFVIHLWRQGAVGQGELQESTVPVVTVDGAALHQGELIIRRSPLLDLRTGETAGVTRSDLPASIETGSAAGEESPLGIQPYRAYRFATTPFTVRLKIVPVTARTYANVQTILRIAERERTLETQVVLNVQNRRIYHMRLLLPVDLKDERVSAPGEFEWSMREQDGRKLLEIYLAAGQMRKVTILVRGTLGEPGLLEQVPIPRIEVLDVAHQQGDIVVQADPAFEVEATDLSDCRLNLMKRVYGWLDPKQRELARIALHYSTPEYGGMLRLSERKPMVSCSTVTNVRVTDRAIEETILLDFTIHKAGVREVSFLLPQRMRDSKIDVPLLRQKTIEPASDGPEAPVRVRLELQDKVMGQLRILIENDRLLTPQIHITPIPIVETGRTDQRYVLLENAGRDEILIEKQQDLDDLGRQQKEWKKLAAILGKMMTQAYVVRSGAAEPVLSFKTKDRSVVETAGARIGLSQTLLVVDANGSYRAAQSYRVDNTTEQFLEIELPAGAQLWTARVAGEPVKPTRIPISARPRSVRIPLVKTAPGDLDYEVVLKYGGSLPPLGRTASVAFPLIRAVNINAELSQVRLFLPETYEWFDFDGSMRLVTDEGDLAAGFISYQTKRAQRLIQTMRSASDFSQVRAASSLKRLQKEMDEFQKETTRYRYNTKLQQEWASNVQTIEGADQQRQEVESQLKQEAAIDNRGNLNEYFVGQQGARARGAVKEAGSNFAYAPPPAPATQLGEAAGQFDTAWFEGNQLVFTVPAERRETLLLTAPPEQREALQQRIEALEAGEKLQDGKTDGSLSFQFKLRGRRRFDQSEPQAPNVAQQAKIAEVTLKYGAKVRPVDEERRSGRQPASQRILKEYAQQLEHRPAGPVQAGVSGGGQLQLGVPAREVTRRSAFGDAVFADDFSVDAGLDRDAVAAGAAGGLPAGLASLDVAIPEHGSVYRFTTPRGKVEITARAISHPFLGRLEQLAMAVVVALIVWQAYRRIRWEGFAKRHGRRGSTALIVAGALSVLTGVLPIAGVVAIIVGIVMRVRLPKAPQPATQPAN